MPTAEISMINVKTLCLTEEYMMKKHMRIAALQCNFQTREETLAMPGFWQDFGFDTEQLLHTHADMYSAIYDEKRHGELLREYLQRSEACNISTIVYMNCHILGPSIADRKTEWGVRDAQGNYPLSYGTYPACCLNSSWRDYFFDCVESLKKFNIFGLFFDGPHYTPCTCSCCQAKFEAQFNKKYSQATAEEISRFTYITTLEFKEALYKKVKSVNPQWQMYFNEGLFVGRVGSQDFARQLATDDIIGTEGGFFYYSEPKNHNPWYCFSSAKLAEAVAGNKPTVIFFAGDHKPWGWFMHTPAETALCYISALGNGASIWYGIHCTPDNLDSTAGQMAKKLVAFDKKYDALYQSTSSLAEVAVFYSYDTAAHYRKSGEASDLYGDIDKVSDFPGDYRSSTQGAFGLLHHLNMPYDVVCELNLDDLKRYKVIIAPSLAMVSDRTRDAICEFAANGGIVIADGEFGFYDEQGKKRTQGAFEAVTGVKFQNRYLDHKVFNYCAFPDFYAADNSHSWLPAPGWSAAISVNAPGEIFGLANPPMRGCYEAKPADPSMPYAAKTAYGKGMFYYISGGALEYYFNYTNTAWRKFFSKLIKSSINEKFVLHNATTGVAVSVRQSSENCTLVHLTNYTSSTRPIEQSAALHDLVLEVPEQYTAAEDIWNECPLKMLAPGKFAIEQLSEVAVIKLT